MNEYALMLVCMCALVALSSFVFYGKSLEGSARFALGIILLSAVIAPAVGIVSSLADIELSDYAQGAENEGVYESCAEDAFCEGVELALAEKFSLSTDDIEVACSGFDMSLMKAERVKVSLRRDAVTADVRAVRQYVISSNLGDCEVDISFE